MYSISGGRLAKPDLRSFPQGSAIVAKTMPIGPLVTDGLVLALEPNNPISCLEASKWIDVSGSHSTLTIVGSPSFLQNPARININAVVQYFMHNNLVRVPSGNSEFTVESWVRLTTSTGGSQYVWVSGGSNVGIVYGLVCTSNSWLCYTGPGFGPSATVTNRPLNVWTHVVGTRNRAGLLTCYVNTLAGTTNIQSGSLIVTQPHIGVNPSNINERFLGDIGLIKVYNRALSPTEINRNYQITRGLFGV